MFQWDMIFFGRPEQANMRHCRVRGERKNFVWGQEASLQLSRKIPHSCDDLLCPKSVEYFLPGAKSCAWQAMRCDAAAETDDQNNRFVTTIKTG